jgi:nucleotide-binding universal stress UspA family protein
LVAADLSLETVERLDGPASARRRPDASTGDDLIVVGTHGRRGFSKFFLGSVAERVIATAPCPVMTFRGK